MVRITKVYTRQGDQGTTRLAGGQEILKTSERIEAYGTVDELNACIGLIAESLRSQESLSSLRTQLLRIQNELFNLGSQLAVLPQDRRPGTPTIRQDNIDQLETEMDTMNESLEDLSSFILPGGGEISARTHLARCICRRAERQTLRVSDGHSLDGTEIPYLNRLSDWLFVAGRYIAHEQGFKETLW